MAHVGFHALSAQLAEKGASDPDALAAYIGRRKYGVGKFAQLAHHAHARKSGGTRSAGLLYGEILRFHPLEDIHIVRAADGGSSGRVVEAFAAVFGQQAEIVDHEGHYMEVIERSAFRKRLDDLQRSRAGVAGVKVLFNHGRTIDGTPAAEFSKPIAVPLSIEATDRGLLTRAEYTKTPLGEEILELIKAGAISTQSFSGKIVRSMPQLQRGRVHRRGSDGQLPLVRRTELGLKEFSPVVFEAYSGAEVCGVRMSLPGALDHYDEQETDTAAAQPAAAVRSDGTSPDGDAAAGAPPEIGHPTRHHQNALFRMKLEEQMKRAGIVLPG